MKLKECRLATGGDLYSTKLPGLPVKFGPDIALPEETVLSDFPTTSFEWLLDRKLIDYLAYWDARLGLRMIKLVDEEK